MMLASAEIWAECIRHIEPKENLSVSEFAAKYRWLNNEGGGHVGKWDNESAPYLVEPMNCLSSMEYLSVAVVGPGQSGKTEIGQNWLARSIKSDPGNFLWYMQTDASLKAFVMNRINTMIDKHDFMREGLGANPEDNSVHFKKWMTMTAEFLSATHSNLINKSAPRILADEIDNYPPSVGNIKPLLDVRRQTFGMESMLLAISHPDLARGLDPDRDWSEGIMSIYADSDRRVWYWRCPHCGAYSSPCPYADRYMVLDYPEDGTLDEVQDNARLVCPINGCLITEPERMQMNSSGIWVGTGQQISLEGEITGDMIKRKTAGFWIVGAMSPFIHDLGGIGALARARVKAEREFEASGEEETIRQVMVKQYGVPYTPPRLVGSVTANDLAERSEHILQLRLVPEGVRFLTAAWDVQLAHFDVLVRGWGERGESWIIDRFRISAEAATSPEDWDKMLERIILAVYPLENNPKLHMPIRACGYDSAGIPGVTQQAYDAWTRWKNKNLVRLYGKVNGRDAWSVVPMKGASTRNAHRLSLVYPDTSGRKDRKASRGNVPVAIFNPNLFKDDLGGQLQKHGGGPWSVHFPAELKSKQEPHEWFEQLVSEQRAPNGSWDKKNKSIRNEALDLMVMTHALAYLHGVSQINWGNPPSWAAPWEDNSFLIVGEKVAPQSKKDKNITQGSNEPGVRIITEPSGKSSIINKLA